MEFNVLYFIVASFSFPPCNSEARRRSMRLCENLIYRIRIRIEKNTWIFSIYNTLFICSFGFFLPLLLLPLLDCFDSIVLISAQVEKYFQTYWKTVLMQIESIWMAKGTFFLLTYFFLGLFTRIIIVDINIG